jgi:hypothetical protein
LFRRASNGNCPAFGAIEGNTARIHFKSGGVYVVKIVYRDRAIPPEIRMVYVAAGKLESK